MKILVVEDGSVDLEDIENLEKGKVLTYRQGAQAPYVLDIEKTKNETIKLEFKAFANEMKCLIQRFMYSCDRKVVESVWDGFSEILKVYNVKL